MSSPLFQEHQQLDRIERILKPSVMDQDLIRELGKRIKKTEETCSAEDCKALLEEPAEGETRTQTYDECMNTCREKERYSYDKFEELEKKRVYWRNFSEVRKGKTVEDALTYWSEIREQFKVTEKEQLQLEKIERILKPSTADRDLYKQLSNRIAETAKDCIEIWKNMVKENIRTIEQYNKLMNAYHRCMNETKMKEQKSFALRDEIRSKRGSWMQFTYVRTQSAEHMQTYWTDARVNYKLLEEEDERYEAALIMLNCVIKATLRLTKEETKLKEELNTRIREQYKSCATGECADLLKAVLKAKMVKQQDAAAARFTKCMTECETAVEEERGKLEELQIKNQRCKSMKRMREQESITAALWRYEKDQLYYECDSNLMACMPAKHCYRTNELLEKIENLLKPSQADERIREELQERLHQVDDRYLVYQLDELEVKKDQWSAFQSTKENMSLEEAENTWSRLAYLLPTLRVRVDLLARIERFLKPSEAYRRTQEEFEERVRNAEKACEQKTCKDLWENPGKNGSHNKMNMLISLHNDCIEEYKREQRSFDILEQLDMKQQYWAPFQLVKERMTYSEAKALWSEVKTALPLLLPREELLEKIERMLRPAPSDKLTRLELEALVQDEEVQRLSDLLTELDTKQHYWSLVPKVVEEMTYEETEALWLQIKAALPQLLEIQELAEKLERMVTPSEVDQQVREEEQERLTKEEKPCDEQICQDLLDKWIGVVKHNRSAFGALVTLHADCLDECKTQDEYPPEQLAELNLKYDQWRNYLSIKDGLTYRVAPELWRGMIGPFPLQEVRDDILEEIERFLKPSKADKRRRKELQERINTAENVCKQGICKDLREKVEKGVEYNMLTRLMVLHYQCMEECTRNTQESLDLLVELDMKLSYWSFFKSVKEGMTLEEAETLMSEIKGEMQILMEEYQQVDRIERILKPSVMDQDLIRELGKRVKKTEETCSAEDCKALLEEPAEGETRTQTYDECMNTCREKERYSYDKLEELEKKSVYWRNFSEVRKGRTVEDALTYWTEIRDQFKVTEKVLLFSSIPCLFLQEQLQLEKIERILKPSTADRNLYKQLSNKTAEAAKDCGEIRKNIVEENDRTIGQFNKLMNAYDRCMNEAKMKEQKSFALRDEIRSKRGSWMEFANARTQSAEHIQTYWTDARVNYKLLEEEDERYEAALIMLNCVIKATLRLTKEETKLKEELNTRIREQYKSCATGECADLLKAVLKAKMVKQQDAAAARFTKCMTECETAVEEERGKLHELRVKNHRCKSMKRMREQESITAALWHYEKDQL
ncbi:hypothetical protein M514_06427, partial [Trichuris suis]